MKTGSSRPQWGQTTRSVREGPIESSRSQARHLKCIIGAMKSLLVMLLMTASGQDQSIADAARKERERQSALKPTVVISASGNSSSAPVPPKEVPKLQAPSSGDALKLWNEKADQLRAKIQMLQDQEMALQLEQT